MREYLIRDKDDEEFDIPHQRWAEVLRPKSFASRVIAGWGALRLEVAGCEISFSPESSGIQISFESKDVAPEVADAIVREVVESAEAFTGKSGKIIPLQ